VATYCDGKSGSNQILNHHRVTEIKKAHCGTLPVLTRHRDFLIKGNALAGRLAVLCVSVVGFDFYSYRSASTGSRFEARSAGTIPLATPTSSRTPVESSTVISEIFK
jgi:hypothetical protein